MPSATYFLTGQKVGKKALANLNSLTDGGSNEIELLERKFAESYFGDFFCTIYLTNRKDFLIVIDSNEFYCIL
jgi:hypothetical protein